MNVRILVRIGVVAKLKDSILENDGSSAAMGIFKLSHFFKYKTIFPEVRHTHPSTHHNKAPRRRGVKNGKIKQGNKISLTV